MKKRGGEILLETPVEPGDFVFKKHRLTHVKISGTKFPVRGCYWSAGRPFFFAKKPRRESFSRRPKDVLLLSHFLARGRAPLPYHWVRLPEADSPLMPPLAYYPAHFSRRNAPPGHYSIGATLPVPAAMKSRSFGSLADWVRDDPEMILGPTRNYLIQLGLLRPNDVIKAFSETVVLPSEAQAQARRGAASKFENFWSAPDFAVHSPEESGVSMQIESAFKALDAILAQRAMP
ncbi:MAG TPA: hypothetical protein VNK24_03245 [Elusimicrobiota bacterium]|nr:hypothetical protein [Elusimicrobiota bacterium]